MSFVLKDNLKGVKENAKRFLREFKHNNYSHSFERVTYRGIAAEIFFNKKEPEGLSNRDIQKCYTKLFNNTLLSGRKNEVRNLICRIPVTTLRVNVPLESPYPFFPPTTKCVKFIPDTKSTFTEWNSVELVINDDFDLEALNALHTTAFHEIDFEASRVHVRNRMDHHFMYHITTCLERHYPITQNYAGRPLGIDGGTPDEVYQCLRNGENANFAIREDYGYPIIKELADGNVTLDYGHLKLTSSPIAKIVWHILKSRSKLGISADGQNLIFVEIDHKQTVANLHNCFTSDENGESVPTVILKLLHRRLDSQCPTATTAALTKLYTAYNDTKNESEQAREEMIENYEKIWDHIRNRSGSGWTQELAERLFRGALVVSGDDIVERLSFHNCSIFKIKARAFKSVIIPEDLVGLHDDDILVVKLPYMEYDKYVVDPESVRHENSFVRVLSKLEGFNNCYLRHNDVEIVINSDYVEHGPEEYEFPSFYKGPFILSRYIERVDVTTAEIKDKFEKQFEILLKYGILHDDLYEDDYEDNDEIAMRNVIYDGEKVYIIDFGDAAYYRDAVAKSFD